MIDHINAADLMPKDENILVTLRKRAEVYSKKNINDLNHKNQDYYICFKYGKSDHYGVPYKHLNEVLDKVIITPLPCLGKYISGVINWRGSLVSVIDLKKLLGTSHVDTDNNNQSSQVIVMSHANSTIGICVDTIIGTMTYNHNLSRDISISNLGIDPRFLVGLHNGRVGILNIESIFNEINNKLTKTE